MDWTVEIKRSQISRSPSSNRGSQSRSLRAAADGFLRDPLGKPPIPNWNRVSSAIPDFFDRLLEAVGADNRMRLAAAPEPAIFA